MEQRSLFLNHLAQTSDFPLMLEIERAEGCKLYDVDGKEYIDLISGISVSNVGHRHPKVVEAIKDQVDKYMYLMVYGEYIQSPQVELAKLLSDNLPDDLNSTYYVNSGSEAVEGAIKLAKRYTRKTEIISCLNAYHGSTHGSLSVMGSEKFKNAFRPLLPGVKHIEYNNLNEVEKITGKTACVILEVVQGEAGIISGNEEFVCTLADRCKQVGALLIVDEIQTGFGRTGKLFGFEHFGITPDIITLAKGMGGGMPIGAFISSKEIMDCLKNNPILGHITTFGGHPVCCAASLSAFKVLLEEDLYTQVAHKEQLFIKELVHPSIKNIRSKGLMMALEFESFEQNKQIIDACIANGVITDWFLFNDKSMRIAPPLIISDEEIKKSCLVINECIDSST